MAGTNFHPNFGAGLPQFTPPTPPNPLQGIEDLIKQHKGELNEIDDRLKKLKAPNDPGVKYGTRDLAWFIPALLAALSGQNGAQLAAGLLSGALQGKGQGAERAYKNAYQQYEDEARKIESEKQSKISQIEGDEQDWTRAYTKARNETEDAYKTGRDDKLDRQNDIQNAWDEFNHATTEDEQITAANKLRALKQAVPSEDKIRERFKSIGSANERKAREEFEEVAAKRERENNGEVSDADEQYLIGEWGRIASQYGLGKDAKIPPIRTGKYQRTQLVEQYGKQIKGSYPLLDDHNLKGLSEAQAQVAYYQRRMESARNGNDFERERQAYNKAVQAYNAAAEGASTYLNVQGWSHFGEGQYFGVSSEMRELLRQAKAIKSGKLHMIGTDGRPVMPNATGKQPRR